MKVSKEIQKQKRQELSEKMKNVNFQAIASRTKYAWLCWFLTYLYVAFIVVCTFVKFDVEYIKLAVGVELTDQEINLLSLWSATTDTTLKGIKLYGLLFGMGLVGLLVDFILIKFLWGGLFDRTQRAINKVAKMEREEIHGNFREYKKQMKALKEGDE